MALYENMQELIGNTPIVRLNHLGLPDDVRLYAKLELYNPSGSVKDRIGKYMIDDAERKGILKKGSVIVEATAGNTGLGIAFAALNRGYQIIFVVPTKFSQEAEEIRSTIPDAVTLEQFKNPSNPLAHYETTGKEIYDELDGNIDYLVAGAGSGGTYSGVVKYLKEKNRNIVGVLADPVGSTMGGGEHGDYDIEGIGNDFIADTMDMTLVDKVVKMTDSEAFEEARELARAEGIFAGSSSGAALAAAKKLIADGAKGNIVVIFPDRGDRYFTKNLYE